LLNGVARLDLSLLYRTVKQDFHLNKLELRRFEQLNYCGPIARYLRAKEVNYQQQEQYYSVLNLGDIFLSLFSTASIRNISKFYFKKLKNFWR